MNPNPAFVVGKIAECDRYASLNPHFAKAFEFLRRPDLATLAVGRYEIDGDKVYAMVSEPELHPLEGAKVEAHRRYVDIQAPLSGPEVIGVKTMSEAELALPFDVEKDYVLFDAPTEGVTLNPGEFILLFPPMDAHAPCCVAPGSSAPHRKVVVKVLAQ